MAPKEVTDKYDFTDKVKLGQGTFGTVYKCLSRRLNQHVAVKRCQSVSDKDKQMIEREIETMQSIPDHRNIIKFLDHLRTSDNDANGIHLTFWIVTELCDLGNLGTYMTNTRPTMDEKLIIMKQCVEGVRYLHNLRPPVIHRDIKPENILFKKEKGQFVTVKIADFGLAKVLTKSTQLRTIGGTALYMAPELVLEKSEYDFSVDVFSLGMVFLTILLYDKANELIPISASAIKKKVIQSVATEMILAKLENKPMPDIAPPTEVDGFREHGAKKIINSMVVYEPENRMNLDIAEHDISYIIPRAPDENPVLMYQERVQRQRYESFTGPSVLECMLDKQDCMLTQKSHKPCEVDPHIQERFTQLMKRLHYDQIDREEGGNTFELLNNACHGDLAALQRMKEDGVNMKLKDYDERTALHLAAVEGRMDCVKFLLEDCDFIPNPKDRWQHTPADEAKSRKHMDVYKFIQESTEKLVFPLLYAAAKGDITTLKRMKSKEVDMSLEDYDGRTALHLAAAEGHLNCVKFLIETCKVQHCPKDRRGQTPLTEAKQYHKKDIVKYLEEHLSKNGN